LRQQNGKRKRAECPQFAKLGFPQQAIGNLMEGSSLHFVKTVAHTRRLKNCGQVGGPYRAWGPTAGSSGKRLAGLGPIDFLSDKNSRHPPMQPEHSAFPRWVDISYLRQGGGGCVAGSSRTQSPTMNEPSKGRGQIQKRGTALPRWEMQGLHGAGPTCVAGETATGFLTPPSGTGRKGATGKKVPDPAGSPGAGGSKAKKLGWDSEGGLCS